MMRASAEYEGMRNAIFGFACAICSRLGAFSSENSITRRAYRITSYIIAHIRASCNGRRRKEDAPCPRQTTNQKRKFLQSAEKSPRRRWKRALWLLPVLLTLLILRVERNVTDVVLTLSQATARSLAIQALNEAASEMLGLGVHYADLMTVEKDEQGQVRLIQANTPEMNRLAAPGVPACAGEIDRHGAENRRRAAGQCHRADAAGGRGAGIAVQILPVGSVQARSALISPLPASTRHATAFPSS